MILNTYWGNTRTITGTSYLDIGGRVNIQEQINVGTTTYVYDRGLLDISSLSLSGNKLSLEANHRIDRLNRSTTFGARQWTSGKVRDMRVTGLGEPNDDFQTTLSAITSLTTANPAISYQTRSDYTNTYASLDFSVTGISNRCYSGLIVRSQEPSNLEERRDYFVGIIGSTSGGLIIAKTNGGTVMTTLATASFTAGNSSYNLVAWVKNGEIYGSIGLNQTSTTANGVTYSASVYAKDLSYDMGSVGMYYDAVSTGVTGTMTMRRLTIADITEPILYENALIKSLKTSGVQQVGLPIFLGNTFQTKGNWSTGISNETYFANLIQTSGSSYDYAIFYGTSTYITNSFETEFRGTSGVDIGIGFGSSTSILGALVKVGSTNNSNLLYASAVNGYQKFQKSNPFIIAEHNQWNKIRGVFYYDTFQWYLNGELIGTRLFGSLGDSLNSKYNPALLVSGNGVSGSLAEFRNMKRHLLVSESDSVEIATGTAFSNMVGRFTPNGYQIICGASNITISPLGVSRYNLGITQIISLSTNHNLRGGAKTSIARSDIWADSAGSEDPSLFKRVDNTVTSVYFDSNIRSNTEADSFTDGDIIDSQTNMVSMNMETIGLPFIETLDRVAVSDTKSGVSFVGLVLSHSTTMNFATGSYTTTLDLRKANNLTL